MTIFIKISVEDELPVDSGKYIVFTESEYTSTNLKGTKSFHRLDVRYYSTTKTWDVSNQVVTHWLKEKTVKQ